MNDTTMNKSQVLDQLAFLCQYADDLLKKDIVLEDDLRYVNNEVKTLVAKLTKARLHRGLIGRLASNTIKVKGDYNDLSHAIVYYLLLGWLFGLLWRFQEDQRRESLRRKESLKAFQGRITKVIADIDKYQLADN